MSELLSMKSTHYNHLSTQLPNHEIQCNKEDLRAIRKDIERDREFDRENYRDWFEKDVSGRVKCLKSSFYKDIIEYLYFDGDCPRRMDCWDAPAKWLQERGIIEEILDMDKIKAEEKKQQEFIEKYNEYIFFNEEFDEIIMYRAEQMGVSDETLWNRYKEFVDAISDGRNNIISSPLWSEFCRFELNI